MKASKIFSEYNVKERLFRFFKRNLLLKLFAIALSIAFWAGLVSQDPNITREKTFNNVRVAITGDDTLKKNGLVVTTDLNETPIYASFTASVPQMQYQTAKASNYLPRIDLSSITDTGKMEIPIQTYNTTAYGAVTSIHPSTVVLNVEHYVTQYRVPVQYEVVGSYPANIYGSEPFLDPKTVQVSGPESIVNRVSKAVVKIDASIYNKATEGQVRNTLPFQLYDAEGEEINSNLLQVTSESVKISNIVVTQHLYALKSFRLSTTGLIEGEIASGYYIRSIDIAPSVVYVAGSADLLNNVENIFFGEQLNIDNRSTSFIKNIALNIPSEAVYASSKTAVVSVNIEPVIKSKTISEVPVNLLGKNDKFSYELENKRVEVRLKGPVNSINKLRLANLQVEADASNLEAGAHSLSLNMNLINTDVNDVEFEVFPSILKVTVTEK